MATSRLNVELVGPLKRGWIGGSLVVVADECWDTEMDRSFLVLSCVYSGEGPDGGLFVRNELRFA